MRETSLSQQDEIMLLSDAVLYHTIHILGGRTA